MGPYGTPSWNESYTLGSHDIASDVFKAPCAMGIDEAGRGPVLGPMVYGICYTPVSKSDEFKAIGFNDSKQLSEDERDKLFDRIKEERDWIGYAVTSLMPQDISRWMLGRVNYNLNAMSHDTAIKLVASAIDRGVNVQELYVDTVGDPDKYQTKLKERFPGIGKVVVSKKADALFPTVSAASICAKVTRDDVLKTWVFSERLGDDVSRVFGSGYPGDPNTTAWLNKHIDRVFGFPRLIRFSWSTTGALLEKRAAPVTWYEKAEVATLASAGPPAQSIASFFKKVHVDDEGNEKPIVKAVPSLTRHLRLRRLKNV